MRESDKPTISLGSPAAQAVSPLLHNLFTYDVIPVAGAFTFDELFHGLGIQARYKKRPIDSQLVPLNLHWKIHYPQHL